MSQQRRVRVRPPYGSKKGQCGSCGKPVWLGKASLATPTCHPCRRQAQGRGPDQKVKDVKLTRPNPRRRLAQCRRCDAPVPDDRVAYCSALCAQKRSRSGPRVSTTERGYGSQHQRLRAQLLPQAYGQNCHFCGSVMLPDQELHLDHTPDRTGYRGIAHAWCNSLDGLQRAQEALRRKRLGVSA